ncbi:MAG: NAD(P)H-dependent flavin oxidoreductase [Acidimicrobiales bacterium]
MSLGDVGRLRALLGIEAPVLQSGMGTVAGPELAAAVSNAGGLGILAAFFLTPDDLRAQIGQIRELTDRPFGVNMWLHDDVRSPPDVSALSEDSIRSVQSFFNELRPRFDLEPKLDGPPQLPNVVDAMIEVMIDEEVPVFSTGVGLPEPDLVERFHAVGAKVVSMVATTRDAETVAASGVDVVVAQGAEAGGHRSFGEKRPLSEVVGTGTFSLVPDVVARVGDDVPVVAAGGIVDGRGMAAAIVLGASGVLMGTRFVATAESQANDVWKKRLLSREGETVLSDGYTGQWARWLRSEYTDAWEAAEIDPLPGVLQAVAGSDLFTAATLNGDDDVQPLAAGASFGQIDDLPTAGDVVGRVVADAEQLLGPI